MQQNALITEGRNKKTYKHDDMYPFVRHHVIKDIVYIR